MPRRGSTLLSTAGRVRSEYCALNGALSRKASPNPVRTCAGLTDDWYTRLRDAAAAERLTAVTTGVVSLPRVSGAAVSPDLRVPDDSDHGDRARRPLGITEENP